MGVGILNLDIGIGCWLLDIETPSIGGWIKHVFMNVYTPICIQENLLLKSHLGRGQINEKSEAFFRDQGWVRCRTHSFTWIITLEPYLPRALTGPPLPEGELAGGRFAPPVFKHSKTHIHQIAYLCSKIMFWLSPAQFAGSCLQSRQSRITMRVPRQNLGTS